MAIEAAFIVPHPPLIIPAVGRGEERGIQNTIDSYHEVARQIAEIAPDTIIVTSPHVVLYRDWFHICPGKQATGDMSAYASEDTTLHVAYDQEFSSALSALAHDRSFPAGTAGERDPKLDHATYIPLWFVNHYYTGYKLVRIGLSGFDRAMHYQLGQMIAETACELGRKCVYIASGDLSHKLLESGPYGFVPEGPVFDEEITQAMDRGDFLHFLEIDHLLAETASECGLRSFQIMAGALDGKAVESKLLSYEGPFGVGYGVATFHVTGNDPGRKFGGIYLRKQREAVAAKRAKEDIYVQLARASIESWVVSHARLSISDVRNTPQQFGLQADAFEIDGIASPLPAEMLADEAGIFVSIHKLGELRGCIGTTEATAIGATILQNAVSACSDDPRFEPVTADELDLLEINVDVLTTPEPIDSKASLDPKRYGVIVTKGFRRGLLLPDLDGVDTVDQQISIAKRKAGISDWEQVALERFEVVRHV